MLQYHFFAPTAGICRDDPVPGVKKLKRNGHPSSIPLLFHPALLHIFCPRRPPTDGAGAHKGRPSTYRHVPAVPVGRGEAAPGNRPLCKEHHKFLATSFTNSVISAGAAPASPSTFNPPATTSAPTSLALASITSTAPPKCS